MSKRVHAQLLSSIQLCDPMDCSSPCSSVHGIILAGILECVLVAQSHIWLFATTWTVAHQAPLSTGFSRPEYWSGLPFPSPGVLPDPGIEIRSPALQTDSLPLSHWGSHFIYLFFIKFCFIYFWLWWVFVAARALLSFSEWGLLFVAVRELLTAVAPLVAEHGLWVLRLQ